MDDLLGLARELQDFFKQRNWQFCFIGGLAVQQWSEPRLTEDADLILLTGFGGEESYIDELLRHYEARVPDARDFALIRRVLLLKSKSGFGIDISLGALSFEANAIRRAVDVAISPDVSIRFCTAEDLVVMKAFASRDLDWHDVKMLLVRTGVNNLDWNYIYQELRPLVELKEAPEILTRLENLRMKHSLK